MDPITSHLSKVDLNLLIAFQVLMEERSVTIAAKRLHITQPAMSKTLQRLRDMLGDQLFDNTRLGLVPTPRAKDLSATVSGALSQLAAGLFEPSFDPGQASGEIHIQIPDLFSMAVIPTLYSRLLKHAPGITLILTGPADNQRELLATGKIDFSIYLTQDYGDDFLTFPLGSLQPTCLMRRNHPLRKRELLTMADVLAYPVVSMIYHDLRPKSGTARNELELVEQFLRDYHYFDLATLKTTHVLPGLAALTKSDALMLIVGAFTSLASQHGRPDLIAKRISIANDFIIKLSMIQHRRTENSQLHLWMREQILASWSDEYAN